MEDERSVIVPILAESLTVLNFVVPKDFANRIEVHACNLIEAFERHPAGDEMDPNNKMMQAMSFLIQNAFETYLAEMPEGIDCDDLPDITDPFE